MARWRKRLFRGLTAALVAGLAGAGWLVYEVTQGPALRQQVIAQMRKHFVGAEVALGSARLRLLGGITVDNLTLYRRDDPSRTPILHVPSSVIYHDKEQLAGGKIAIRKLKLVRPRLTLGRAADGRWNLAGILGSVRPDFPIPVIEVEQGTVVLEVAGPADRTPAPPLRLELRHLNLTALNQPLPVLSFEANGEAASYGPLHLHGSWQRAHSRLAVALDLAPVAVGPALVRELGRLLPGLAEPVQEVTGAGRLHLDLRYRPDASPAWGSQVRVELAKGRLVHRDLPLPLDNLDLSARWEDGVVTVERLTATAGPAAVRLKAVADVPSRKRERPEVSTVAYAPGSPHPAALLSAWIEPVRALELTVERLPVTAELFARLPATFQTFQQRYAPAGPLNLTCRMERAAGGWGLRARLEPEGMTGRFEDFPYALRGVRGALELALAGDRPPKLSVDLTAEAADRRPVTIRGLVEGDAPAFSYDIIADAVPIDEQLLQALPVKIQNQVRAFHPRGRCDVTARIVRPAGTAKPRMHYVVKLRDLAVCYDVFPYPLEGLSGQLDIRLGPGTPADPRADTHFTFTDVTARHGGGRVFITGGARPTAEGNAVALTLRGEGVALDDALAAAFARMRLRGIWEMFAPRGRFNFTADVTHLDRSIGPPEYDIRVAPAGATVRPTFFPYTLTDLTGAFRLTPGRVELLRPFTARHGATVLQLGGGAVQLSEGGYRADLRSLRAEPLPVDADLVHALPAALRDVCRALEPRGTLAVQVAQLVIDDPPDLPGPPRPPVLDWNGSVTFSDGALKTGVQWDHVSGLIACRGRYHGQVLERVDGHVALSRATVFGQPLTNLHARALIEPQRPHELQLCDLKGQLFGGQLGGEAHVAFGAGLQYEVNLTGVGLRLEELGRHNRLGGNAQLSGLARAELYLKGAGTGVDELVGAGNLHVPNGRMYNLPLVLDLLKVPALHAPDGTAFEEAHAEFRIHGRKIEVQRLDLLGNAVSLGGKGEMNLDGSDLRMDFYAVWAHIVQLLPPGLRELPPWVSKNLFLLRTRGQLGGQIDVRTEPVPGLVEPVRQLVERARKRMVPGVRAQKAGS